MCTQVLIAQPKPGRSAKSCCILDYIPRFVNSAPACVRVCHACQCITDCIQIGANIQAIMLEVVTGIDNDREVLRRENVRESMGEFRTADTACKGNNFHLLFRLLKEVSRNKGYL